MNQLSALRIPLFLALVAAAASAAPAADTRPNVVFIMTDNHGAWTLGCYGNKDISTPNIDRLAAEGVRFTSVYSSNAVCSPTRATFLTGLIPSQHGVHCYLGGNGLQVGPLAYNTVAEFPTLPRILHQAGYVCGLSGKWHLGDNLKPQEGCTLWITKPEGSSLGFYDQKVIENGEIRTEPQYLTDLWTDRAVEFIERNHQRPFFLFLAYNGPYGLGRAMEEPIRNRHLVEYQDAELPSFPREPMHPWLFSTRQLFDNQAVRRKYAAEISGVDDGVGRVMDTLRRLGLDERTLVIFTADQGLAGGHSGYWGMGDHTRPLSAFDWTMHIPMIVRHAGHVPAGKTCDRLASNYDLLPSVLDYLDMNDQQPRQPASPGRSFAPVLRGQELENRDDTVYFEFENVRAIRTPKWKYIARYKQDPPEELYDLAADPGERRNLALDPAQAAARDELKQRLEAFFRRWADPQYDLWNGGKSKSNLITRDVFGLPNPERPGT